MVILLKKFNKWKCVLIQMNLGQKYSDYQLTWKIACRVIYDIALKSNNKFYSWINSLL